MGPETQIRGIGLTAFWDLESKDWISQIGPNIRDMRTKSRKGRERRQIMCSVLQFFLDRSKLGITSTKLQKRTHDLTSFTALSRLSWRPP